MPYVIATPPTPYIPVVGRAEPFPVHRIYCVGRNYEDHAKEMGHTGREAPFFFMKPADAVLVAEPEHTAVMPYPSLTHNLHHEVELVLAIGFGGRNIKATDAHKHIFGYAVGLDMTRRDLQNEMKKQGRPWCIAKGFDCSAPIGAITRAPEVPDIAHAAIHLQVNGQDRQRSIISKMIWNIGEIVEQLSAAWELQPGDLVFTGTPEGVGPVVAGDTLQAMIDGLAPLQVRVA
jgi:fumarylpyruvate hydrolase